MSSPPSTTPSTFYPDAVVERLLDHSAPGTIAQRDMIVLHITAGSTARSAINTFKASKAPHRVSAHFVIDRDGTVYQLLPCEETGWHASQVNPRSIGIEHAAVPHTLLATEAQYQESARLIAWLCRLLVIPCHRKFIVGHNEASPRDGHVECCSGALDADRVVTLATGFFRETVF